MTNAKHTPGPWGVEKRGDDFNITFNEQGNWLATVFYDDDPDVGRPEADARLIAAAPELLEALREAEGELYQVPPADAEQARVLAVVRAAIAKAIGEAK